MLGRNETNRCYNTIIVEVNKILSCLVSMTMLWYQWLGHISEKELRVIHSKGMVEGFPDYSFKLDFFEHYVYGK